MNIQFRKIHLPPLPEVNTNNLMRLAEDIRNDSFNSSQLPSDVPKSDITNRLSLDAIIQDIEKGKYENVTVLEWIHCLYNKNKWDAQNQDRSISTSKAIWKAAEQNSWLKRKLFCNLVYSYDDAKALAPSLVKTCSSFSPQNSFDAEQLEIVKIFNASKPEEKLAILCCEKLLTPHVLFQEYQLPTRTLILKRALSKIAVKLCSFNNFHQRQIEFLLKCLQEMRTEQQIEAVEYLLINIDPKVGTEHPELINWLRQHYSFADSDSHWSKLSSEAQEAMRKWLGAVSYKDFQKLVALVLERVPLKHDEENRLNSRSIFWSNYSDRFKRIRILLPQTTKNILGNSLNHQDVSELIEDGSDSTEVCIFDIGDWFIVEFFRGKGSETHIFEKNSLCEEKLFYSKLLSVKLLRCMGMNLNSEIHDHTYYWQHFCERLLRSKNIFPNENIQCFEIFSEMCLEYSREKGLPKPSSQVLQTRQKQVERWKEDIEELEREAREYCKNNLN